MRHNDLQVSWVTLAHREEVAHERLRRTCQKGTVASADRAPKREGEAPRSTRPAHASSDERGGAGSRDREGEAAQPFTPGLPLHRHRRRLSEPSPPGRPTNAGFG